MKQPITCAIAIAASLSCGSGIAFAQKAAGKASASTGGDQGFVKEAAMGGLAEVELGRLATQKAQSSEVKQFGQRMVDDHSKANDQLKPIAQRENVPVPTQLTGKEKTLYDRLSKLSGAQFDRAYMRAMVDDHRKDVAAFRRESTGGKDMDVKMFASQTLPTLEDHLKMAQTTAAAVTRGGAKGTSGTADTEHGVHTATPGAGTTGAQQGATKPGAAATGAGTTTSTAPTGTGTTGNTSRTPATGR
jgi:putative membrane protein